MMSNSLSGQESGHPTQNSTNEPTDSTAPSIRDEDIPDGGKHGWVKIKDNRIHVFPPRQGGRPASIHGVAPVTLIVNKNIIAGTAPIGEEDIVTWELQHDPMFEIKVTLDKMEAYLILHERVRYEWNLVDTPAAAQVMVQAVPDRERITETLEFTHIMDALESRHIIKNIDKAAILQELEFPSGKPIVIARGQASVPGTDARLELFFPEQIESVFHEAGGVIDHRSYRRIPSVHEGEVIATKHAPVNGMPGYDVFGNELPPRPAQDLEITPGEFTEMNEAGEIIALRPGRPRMTGRGNRRQVDISSAFVVSGDVDLRTGNIVFAGDVIVHGNVTDHMIIESLGNVYIHGNVYNSTITATGSISIQGTVIGGRVYSGYFGVMFNRMYAASKQLSHEMRQLDMAAQVLADELRTRNQPVRYSQMVMLLIERKFRNIPELGRELLQVFSSIQYIQTKDTEQLKLMLADLMSSASILEKVDEQMVLSMRGYLDRLYASVSSMQEIQVNIELSRCQSSEIKSNGDILITREGVLQSNLYSAGSIAFMKDQSVCRGSRLEAEERIIAGTVGSDANARCVLQAKQHVYVKRLYNGYIIVDQHRWNVIDMMQDQLFDAEYMQLHAPIHSSTTV
ncbi:DUF342 domain-containing protein [Paenibacillus wulumuqiensis]|uniref:DUF342 domain-containing protein n=1 Tax=Paenibacillus wulumuqiensis TaxID=1567107 RepID=UPI00138E2007|nr:FapA family protein [Paenibacillus wulumuqiensis]